jgi:putative heme-binding domain-containing protein
MSLPTPRQLLILLAASLTSATGIQAVPPISEALNEFVAQFKGRGAITDDSKPLSPMDTLGSFQVAQGLEMQLVAAEPLVRQPLNLHFDARGRLWVVQYLQYPFPAGLQIVQYDEYLRAVYDKTPEPPPKGTPGLDRITILEDRDNDGQFESAKDFISGLNIATSVLTGGGGVWVLNPPYLLFYPDRDQDDRPDSDPEVRLSGFGLEDTHATANSLHWGPDGWIYGAQGSTCTSKVAGIHFKGQAIWRYHPESHRFEIFAEGGGNTYSLEFDRWGRCFSGTNGGGTRGLHHVQGGASVKSWAKHGPLINPHSFGFFEHMAHKGFQPRFSQSLLVYEGGALPGLEGHLISSLALVNRVQDSRILPKTSSFQTEDAEPLVLTSDRWFRPVDTKAGPDGAVYFADWYDSRLSHVDPRDTWDHDRGRIYRLQAAGAKRPAPVNLQAATTLELLQTLRHPNKWHRQTAVRLLHERRDPAANTPLRELLHDDTGPAALEALWALHGSGALQTADLRTGLTHPLPTVRAWSIRLLGDQRIVNPELLPLLLQLARQESSAEVRSQLASSARRLPPETALALLTPLLAHSEDDADLHIPLLLWWTLESSLTVDFKTTANWLQQNEPWKQPLFIKHLAPRVFRRCAADPSEPNLLLTATLLEKFAPKSSTNDLLSNLELGLRGHAAPPVPEGFRRTVSALWPENHPPHALLQIGFRIGLPEARNTALNSLSSQSVPLTERLDIMELLGEYQAPEALEPLLQLVSKNQDSKIARAALRALQRFEDQRIPDTLLATEPPFKKELLPDVVAVLSSRAPWARQLLLATERNQIRREDIPTASLLGIQSLHHPECDALIRKLWSRLRPSSLAKEQRIRQVRTLLKNPGSDLEAGRELFGSLCANCHTLKGAGGRIGPDLTGYERTNLDFILPAIVDPSLAIREEYTAFEITTTDRQILVGFITEETPQTISLTDLSQHTTRLPRSQIKASKALATSLMPEGLLDALTDSQIRDLFAYLTAP